MDESVSQGERLAPALQVSGQLVVEQRERLWEPPVPLALQVSQQEQLLEQQTQRQAQEARALRAS